MLTSEKYHNTLFYAGLVLFLITAWFSTGFIHPDEHFQILEFISNRMGTTPDSAMAWEFEQKIRPGLAVFFGYNILSFLRILGLDNPFLLAFVLRLVVALSTWFVISKILKNLKGEFSHPITYTVLIFCSFFLWFMPYIQVRFSSENLGSLFFLSAVLMYLIWRQKFKNHTLIFVGLFLAFSFFCRFQMAFAFIGFGCWMIFSDKLPLKLLPLILLGLFIGYGIGMAADYWLYGVWTATPLNYFQTNIIDGVAAEFGTSPWWDYFRLFFFKAVPPFSIIILILTIIGIITKPKSLFTWIVLLFLIGHMIVGHKEMRFLFPIAFPVVVLASFGLDWCLKQNKLKLVKWHKAVLYFLLITNCLILVFRSLSPAREIVNYYEYIYDNQNEVTEIICFEQCIYDQSGLEVYFYRSNHLSCHLLENERDLDPYLDSVQPKQIYVLERNLGTTKPAGYQVEGKYSILPSFIIHFNFNNWLSRSKVWRIVELKSTVNS